MFIFEREGERAPTQVSGGGAERDGNTESVSTIRCLTSQATQVPPKDYL